MMKLISRFCIITLASSCFVATYAMEDSSIAKWSHNTYQGKQITPDNMFELSVKAPEPLLTEITTWFANDKNREIVKTLNTMPTCKTVEEIRDAIKEKATYLEQNSIKNLTKYNYIFRPENKNFIVRIAGIIITFRNRIASILHENPFPEDLAKCGYDWEKATGSKDPLYQHTSCAAYYLRIKEIEPYLKHLHIVPTYLFPLTESPQKPCSDSNYATIHEFYNNEDIVEIRTLPKEEQQKIFVNLSEETLKELFFATKYAALWDVKNNLMINKKTKDLWIGDLEQPSNNDAAFFFYNGERGLTKYNHDVNNGLGYMRDLLAENAPEKHQLWLSWMNQDWESFMKEMMSK